MLSFNKPADNKDGQSVRLLVGRFAAVIPGNSTAEFVIANGFLNFLYSGSNLICLPNMDLYSQEPLQFCIGWASDSYVVSLPTTCSGTASQVWLSMNVHRLMTLVGSTICDPYLNLFRGIIPPVGGIDFSPILAFVVLNV